MTHDEIRTAWNAQADEHNRWDELGEDEKIEWAASIAAAKERAARQAAQEGWTPVSERMPDFMDFCDWLMPMTDAKRERWILANESMATASVPGAATHWRKAQALPELTAHQPPVVNDSLTTESTVNQKVTVQVPPFTHTAKRKLDDLLAQGFRVTGYAIERADIADWAPQRGFVTHGGFVGWWRPMMSEQGYLSKDQIREILLAHGFTIKDGESDLKPYVYAAVRALLDAAPGRPAK